MIDAFHNLDQNLMQQWIRRENKKRGRKKQRQIHKHKANESCTIPLPALPYNEGKNEGMMRCLEFWEVLFQRLEREGYTMVRILSGDLRTIQMAQNQWVLRGLDPNNAISFSGWVGLHAEFHHRLNTVRCLAQLAWKGPGGVEVGLVGILEVYVCPFSSIYTYC